MPPANWQTFSVTTNKSKKTTPFLAEHLGTVRCALELGTVPCAQTSIDAKNDSVRSRFLLKIVTGFHALGRSRT